LSRQRDSCRANATPVAPTRLLSRQRRKSASKVRSTKEVRTLHSFSVSTKVAEEPLFRVTTAPTPVQAQQIQSIMI
ncbi:MAG TPA: hypothetical protein PLD89_10340, partial [Promineifilum sp.]|nr:hypothetical protein [Promineifilum sp.]